MPANGLKRVAGMARFYRTRNNPLFYIQEFNGNRAV